MCIPHFNQVSKINFENQPNPLAPYSAALAGASGRELFCSYFSVWVFECIIVVIDLLL